MAEAGKAYENVFTVVIGGAAGDGVREAGSNLGLLVSKVGYEVFYSIDYPSLIRGGHNFARVSFSKEPLECDYRGIDVLIAMNEETMKLHRDELNPGAVIIAEQFDEEDKNNFGQNAFQIPLLQLTRDMNAPIITRSSAALGAVCYLLNLPFEVMVEDLKRVFKDKSMEANITLAEKGYELMKQASFRHSKPMLAGTTSQAKELIEGNAAFARGIISTGLQNYVAYPMTPSTSILHYLAKVQKDSDLRVIQPENEISAINMALGMAYAGKRVAIGTAGGGFALMHEALSFAGMAELPLVIAMSQRYAPATGLPTYTSQSDLLWTLSAGHGEFPRIVLAPGDAEEAYDMGAQSLNLAWRYQTPVIVLLDKHLSESMMTATIPPEEFPTDRGKLAENPGPEYERYAQTDDGISPLAFPGAPGAVVRATSYEHDSAGLTTEKADVAKAMHDKRFRKINTIAKDRAKIGPALKIYGDPNSDTAIVFWGSTKGAVLEAAKYLSKPVKLVQVVWMEPFDSDAVFNELTKHRVVIDVEVNRTGQLARLIRERTGLSMTEKVLRYDGRPFDPVELAAQIEKIMS